MNSTPKLEQKTSECSLIVLPNNQKANSDERLPHCQRCAQHKVRNRLRGHKSICPFKDCQCAKCLIVVKRQRLMADQIKLRRQQRKQRNLHRIQTAMAQPNLASQQQRQSNPDEKQVVKQSIPLFANLNLLLYQQHSTLLSVQPSPFNKC